MADTLSLIWQEKLSLWRITQLYRVKVIITWILLLLESSLIILFPLVIGFSVDTLLENNNSGLIILGVLSAAVLIIGAGRRFYDTRAYASIFRELANSLVTHEKRQQTPTSNVTARINLLYEVIEFLENSLPMLLGSLIGFIGVIIILAMIDINIMLLCLFVSVLVITVYALIGQKIFDYNKQQNDELEQQVAVLSQNRKRRVSLHFMRMMKWNIKLSDLETASFSLVWIMLGGLLIGSIILIVENTGISYGQKITSIMYVFQYIEVVMGFPVYYQQFVRLSEITHRLSNRL